MNGNDYHDCASYMELSLDIIFLLYSLFVLLFIVNYMNVVINEYRPWARIFLMHTIGTSLVFLVYAIVQETAIDIARTDAENYGMYLLYISLPL